MQGVFVSATDTGVGKTYFAAQLIADLIKRGYYQAEEITYYKPIQCGLELRNGQPETDADFVLRANPGIKVFNSYFFEYPAAPNFAALLENKSLDLKKIHDDFAEIKKNTKFVVVEGAGGLAVPLTDQYLVSDLARDFALPLILLIRPDLGTINHSLLSIEHARNKNLHIMGIQVSVSNPTDKSCYTKQDPVIDKLQKQSAIDTILSLGNVRLFDLTNELTN